MLNQDYLNIFDFYGFRPKLYIGGFSKNGSCLGVLSTLFSLIIFVVIFTFYLYKLIYHSEIYVLSSQSPSKNSDFINFSKDTFFFGFSLEDPITYDPFIDESVYYPKAYFRLAIRNEEDNSFTWTEKDRIISMQYK